MAGVPKRDNLNGMEKPPFQFGLGRLLLIVGASAVGMGVLRVLWGTMALVAVIAAAGLGCLLYGAGKNESNRQSAWPLLLVLFGTFLICGAMCGGFVLQGIE